MFILPYNCRAQTAFEYEELYIVSGAEKFEEKIPDDVKSVLTEFEIELNNPNSFDKLNGFDLIKVIISNSLSDVSSPMFAVCSIGVMALIYAVMSNISPQSEGNRFGITSYILPCSCLVTIAANMVELVNNTASAVSSCSIFMLSFVPIYAGVLISSGSSATGSAYSSLMFIVSQVFCTVADGLIIPFCGSMSALSIGSIFNNICEKVNDFIKKTAIAALTFGMTVFTFVLGLQSSISAASDTVGVKASKMAVGTLIPIVGSSLSESLSVIIGSLSLFKSTIGAYAMISLAIMLVPPLIGIIVWKAAISVLCITVQSVGAESAYRVMKMMSSVLTVLLCVLLCCGAAYIVSIALTISARG